MLQFEASGRVRVLRDDAQVLETHYDVTVSRGGPTQDQTITVDYDDPLPLAPGIMPAQRQLVVILSDGTLLLRNLASCADCYGDWTFLPSLVH